MGPEFTILTRWPLGFDLGSDRQPTVCSEKSHGGLSDVVYWTNRWKEHGREIGIRKKLERS